jgi:hypothetical protein
MVDQTKKAENAIYVEMRVKDSPADASSVCGSESLFRGFGKGKAPPDRDGFAARGPRLAFNMVEGSVRKDRHLLRKEKRRAG